MKRHIIALVFAVALAAPAMALACTAVTNVDAAFNCDGWNAVVVVEFTGDQDEVTLDWAVSLLDSQENPLEWFADRVIIQRPDNGETIVRVPLVGEWQNFHTGTGFQAAIAAEVTCAEPNGFIQQLECTVAQDGISWDSVKSQYR